MAKAWWFATPFASVKLMRPQLQWFYYFHDFDLASKSFGLDFSPNSVSTLSGSYGRCQGRCLIRVLNLGRGIFPVNFCKKWLLWNLDIRFDCAGSHQVWAVALGGCMFPVNFCMKWLLWNLDMRFDCAGSHKVSPCVLLLVLSCLVLSRLVLSCHVLSRLVMSCLLLFSFHLCDMAICCFGSQCLSSNRLTHEPTHRIWYTCTKLFETWQWTSKHMSSSQHRKKRVFPTQSTYSRHGLSHVWPSTSYMHKVFYLRLAKRSHKKILSRRSCQEISSWDLAKRTLYRDLVQEVHQVSYINLAKRTLCTEVS